MKLFPRLILGLCFLISGSSCGNLINNGAVYAPSSSINVKPITTVTSDYTCAQSSNITPISSTGTYDYTVCTSSTTTNYNDIEVQLDDSRVTASTFTVCVFPAYTNTAPTSVTSINDTSGAPLYVCSQLNANVAKISFSGLNSTFNTAYLIAGTSLSVAISKMQSCLLNTQISCPAYSFGKFR